MAAIAVLPLQVRLRKARTNTHIERLALPSLTLYISIIKDMGSITAFWMLRHQLSDIRCYIEIKHCEAVTSRIVLKLSFLRTSQLKKPCPPEVIHAILCVMVLVYFCLISLYFVRGLAGEVPIMGGVLGDVPRGSSITSTAFTARHAELSNVTTPGKLRVVENSGVCGILLILASQLTLKMSMQKPPQASFRHPDMAI